MVQINEVRGAQRDWERIDLPLRNYSGAADSPILLSPSDSLIKIYDSETRNN